MFSQTFAQFVAWYFHERELFSAAFDAARLDAAGAEKVSVNSAAVRNPAIIHQGAVAFGSQCVVLGMDVLKGHKVETVKKEALVYALVYNLVRLVMLKAAQRQRVNPHRISFIDALRWLQPPKPHQPLPDLVVNPERPDRFEPRCLKRRPKEFPLMKLPRRELRKRLRKRPDAA